MGGRFQFWLPPCSGQPARLGGGDLGAAKLRSIRENSNFFRQQLEKELRKPSR